ncbi:MAG: hypothetical protein EWV49_02095 [Microcystis aeruginosa Ma_QC_Ch_20071001_S25]|uniref:Uncharacterized protein n=1 Tax=Microcystis aeruginosa Ma_QC_Ch_20071001_S25D TaxID=2486250 RepID=A0A552G3W2_MICAE|nr:MAG: hypothetical protein EWV57_03260 [Microcystis aeruginosa Ma_QC_Ch_20071001_S25D]TRU54133.1 MAG: hypothetical protein EWV49_02095 [Microcystis aeruginosa Ma_QC_Ch_20071001_S25]TRU58571.1 MAG: hypothetical protein EWV90_18635 [Microcystis aeruginosa Ma_QC_Ch_20071001_M135]
MIWEVGCGEIGKWGSCLITPSPIPYPLTPSPIPYPLSPIPYPLIADKIGFGQYSIAARNSWTHLRKFC